MLIEYWKKQKFKGSDFTTIIYDQDKPNSKDYPYAMICLFIEDNTIIAVGSDPISPRDFMNQNIDNTFMIDESLPPKNLSVTGGIRSVYYAKKITPETVENNDDIDRAFIDKQLNRAFSRRIIQQSHWIQIKQLWWNLFPEGQLFIDEVDNILSVKIDNDIFLLDYVYIAPEYLMHKSSKDIIAKSLIEFTNELKELSSSKGYNSCKIIVITTYQLSKIDDLELYGLPTDIIYHYIKSKSDTDYNGFEILEDEIIFDNMKDVDEFLSYAFERSKMMNAPPESNWTCDICGGDNEIGCQYFDPTECPRFANLYS